MNTILQFELKHSLKPWVTGLIAIILIGIGVFCGYKFNLTAGEGIFLNSPYTIGFMMGMLSLSIIFFAILFSTQILFKEWDAKFDIMFFSLPFSKMTYLKGKFLFLFLKTSFSFGLLILGFVIGQNLRIGSEIQAGFNLWHYVYPLIIFGLMNCFVVCSFLFFIAFTTRKKLLVVVGGLLLYVLYMVLLVFSNSPFMSSSLPQSMEAQQLSALLDPFGLSAYFFEARTFSVQEKNGLIVPFSGILFINRMVMVLISTFFLWMSYRLFSFSTKRSKKANKRLQLNVSQSNANLTTFKFPKVNFGHITSFKSAISFAKIDLTYLFKSVPIVAVSILLMFYIGMEMYAEIDKGIRLPEKYASSGILATSISKNFYLFGALILVYFINDLYWRSHASSFDFIEKCAYFSKSKMKGHFLSVSILICFLTMLLIVEALIFQFSYDYFSIDWKAYLGVILFNTFPLILFSAFILLINDNFRNRFVSLGVSTIAIFALATPLSNTILPYPLLQIFSGFKGLYSDFNGYGVYILAFSERLLFGLGLIGLLWLLNEFIKTKVWNIRTSVFTTFLLALVVFNGFYFMNGYMPKDDDQLIEKGVRYEENFRRYETLAQPIITDVTTKIHLYPSENAYQIQGEYILKNKTEKPITEVLINFQPDLKIEYALLKSSSESLKIEDFVTEIKLKKPLQPNEKLSLNFTLSYKWFPVNGHQSFNAIVENGSFMRISNYFPSIGYQKNLEIKDQQKRSEFNLGKVSEVKRLEAPEVFISDFINLDMTLSSEPNQTAIGTGDLGKHWTNEGRSYFNYKAENIPFRFAVSSAVYEHKTIRHKNIDINVYYSKSHFENVDHLLDNAKLTLDYCIAHFGAYPFETVNFAEISSFTKGFAGTAYPSTIFMTEDMIFHTNIESKENQDVINELAGHELSHLWWGNNQINPDDREGATMLTETLAMYTEMMLYKHRYGKEKMMERLEIHHQIYDNEKGLSENQPLYKVTHGNSHIAYSKGAIVMVKLSELIGEEQVNLALKNFLNNNTYPKKPTSLDLLIELFKVAPNDKVKSEIDKLFKTI